MPLNQEDVKRRIHAARLLRDISQAQLNRLGAADGFGREEMGRVERGELEFRPGKHLDPLCRYLNVPRWWFTAETLYFGDIDSPATPDEVSSLLAQQNDLLARQSKVLDRIEKAIDREDDAAKTLRAEGQVWAARAEALGLQEFARAPETQEAAPDTPAA